MTGAGRCVAAAVGLACAAHVSVVATAHVTLDGVNITFGPPVVIGAAYYVDNGFVLAEQTASGATALRVDGEDAVYVSFDSGATFSVLPGAQPFNGVPIATSSVTLRDYGNVTSVANVSAEYTAFFSSFARTYTYVHAADGNVVLMNDTSVNISFTGLPLPVTCRTHFGGCPFRLQGADVVRLGDGSLLSSVIVFWGGGRVADASTSVAAFTSTDGGDTWTFKSVIANASQYPASQEGPNENALSLLSDGRIVCVLRLDAGDGPDTHPYTNYVASYSQDDGATWSLGVPIPAGCARPKLRALHPGGPLLLSGGRWRNMGTTDILVWVNADGMAQNWSAPVSVSYWHNALVSNASLRFTPWVNSTAEPRETTSYTSLLPVAGAQPGSTAQKLVITYDRRLPGVPDVAFAMPITVEW